jgi:multiple antibiotic resistance protein
MPGELLNFALLSLSSLVIIVNPLGATLIYVSLTSGMNREGRRAVARDSCRFALVILLVFALLGGIILHLFGITVEAFRIGGGILLFGIGLEMIYARTSRTKLTATEKYESMESEDISVTPLALPMIAGPGAITTTIVLMNEAAGNLVEALVVLISITVAVLLTYLFMWNSDRIVSHIGQKEFRAINRLMGMLLIAIAVQFVIDGILGAFPFLSGKGA